MIEKQDAEKKVLNSGLNGKKSFTTSNLITSASIILSAWKPLEFQLD